MNPLQTAAVLSALRENFRDAVAEYKFHPTRKWRMDFAIPSVRIGIEIDGGVWSGGRHSGGAGQIKDMEKGNAAAILGWHVLHFTPQQLAQIPAVVWAVANHRIEDEHKPTDTIRRKTALTPKR